MSHLNDISEVGMKPVSDHPWISNPFPFVDADSIRVCMKNVAAMLENDSPPDWIIILDETGRFSHSRTRVVIAEHATIDFEPNEVDDADEGESASEKRGMKITPDSHFLALRVVLYDRDQAKGNEFVPAVVAATLANMKQVPKGKAAQKKKMMTTFQVRQGRLLQIAKRLGPSVSEGRDGPHSHSYGTKTGQRGIRRAV